MKFIEWWPLIRKLLLTVICLAAVGWGLLFIFPQSQTQVLVAARDIHPGDRITDSDFITVAVPQQIHPEDAWAVEEDPPQQWEGADLLKGTILTESNVPGSANGRAIQAGYHRLAVLVRQNAMPEVSAGDIVDVWALPQLCDELTCDASLISAKVPIVSSKVAETSQWGAEPTVRVELLLRHSDTHAVLGHSGAGTLSLVLRHRDEGQPSS